jgi:hypothetical protein
MEPLNKYMKNKMLVKYVYGISNKTLSNAWAIATYLYIGSVQLNFAGKKVPSRHIPGQYLKLSHDCFLPNPFQFIIHPSSCHATQYSQATDSVAKYTIKRYTSRHIIANCYRKI